jgi:rhodanese-related sulfurtransferase
MPTDRPVVVHCQHRDRSTAGPSVLARRGYRDLRLIDGGFAAWSEAGFEVEQGI